MLLSCPRPSDSASHRNYYRDGTRMLLTPESSVEAQKQLGADIIIPLDELPPYHTEQVLSTALYCIVRAWILPQQCWLL